MIIDFDKYFEYQGSCQKSKYLGGKAVKDDFPEDIVALVRREREEIDILEKLNDDNVGSTFSRITEIVGDSYDEIKNLVVNCFTMSSFEAKKIEPIAKLLSKFASHDESKYQVLFKKALIEAFNHYIYYSFEHTAVVYNLCQTCCSDLYEYFFANNDDLKIKLKLESEETRSILRIFQTDNLNDFIEYTSINFDLSEPISHNLFYQKFINFTDPYMIDLAAFYSAVNIFKYLILNDVKVSTTTEYYCVAGGNSEIIRLLMQNNKDLKFDIKVAIEYQKNDVFYWLLEQQLSENPNNKKLISDLFQCAINNRNLEVFLYLIKNYKIKIKEENVYQSIKFLNFIMYRVLKHRINNKYYEKELEIAIECNFLPVIQYILNFNCDDFIITPAIEQELIHKYDYHECKAIVSIMSEIDNSYDFRSNVLNNWDKKDHITLNTVNNLLMFGIDINEVEVKFKIYDNNDDHYYYYDNFQVFYSSLLGYSIFLEDGNKFLI